MMDHQQHLSQAYYVGQDGSQREYPHSGQIDPEQAKYLYTNHCAIFVLEDLPIGCEFGIDLTYYKVGHKFKGLKLIPPGLHFIYASAVDSKQPSKIGPRCGFFHTFKPKELLVKRWSQAEEDFDDEYDCGPQKQRYECNIHDLDPFLGAYDFASYRAFLGLAKNLTPELVASIVPECNRIRAIPYLTRDSSQVVTSRSRRLRVKSSAQDDLLPELRPDAKTVIKFTDIPADHLDSKKQLVGSSITHYYLDTSLKLEESFGCGDDGLRRVIAELEFAFITFVLCHVYDCFEQWKSLLALVANASSLLQRQPQFLHTIIEVLGCQIDHIPKDLFEGLCDSENLLMIHMRTLLQNAADENLERCALELKQKLETKFGWKLELDEEEDDDESKPVIVEL